MPRYSAAQKDALNSLMRDQVYEHAVNILENLGAESLTLERLSDCVGVSRGTLYNYFADRQAIIEFVEERAFSPVLAEIEAIVENDETATGKLERLVKKAVGTLLEDPKIYFELSAAHTKSRKRTDPQEKRVSRIHKTVQKIVQEGIEASEFIAMPAELSTTIILGSMEGVMDELGRAEAPIARDEIVPALLAVILGGLTRGSYVGDWS